MQSVGRGQEVAGRTTVWQEVRRNTRSSEEEKGEAGGDTRRYLPQLSLWRPQTAPELLGGS